VNLSINGGEAFAASVWLNNVFLNTSFGNSTNNRHILEETDDKFTFSAGALIPGKDNVITIIQDNMGLNETAGPNPNSSKGPRGVRGFKLDAGNFTTWKVQGKVGGYLNYPDKVRGEGPSPSPFQSSRLTSTSRCLQRRRTLRRTERLASTWLRHLDMGFSGPYTRPS